ncbi:MAG: exo-alpha-sialidase [Armatimonadetes bacterium]|nr:exo-alpha-sialidase [Armatimonadota bacterium]
MNNLTRKLATLAVLGCSTLLFQGANAQVSGLAERNTSVKTGDDNECAIAANPKNRNQVFLLSNTASAGLFCARSTDGGVTWTYPDPSDKTIADGDAGQGTSACCDPTLAWDSFGNLFITYINANVNAIVTLLSTDGGQTFTSLASFSGSVDQPTVVAASGSVWVVWNQSGTMVARGAAVTGLGTVGAFGALQSIPGTNGSSFGDIAISPSGVVVQVSENPTSGQGPANLIVNIDPDGLGPANFGSPIVATSTNVGGFDFIPAQNARSVDAEAGLAFDSNPLSPHFGRLYLVYTEEVVNESNDMDIMLRYSDNNGTTWSAPIRVNDDATNKSQFLPKIAVNPASGNIAICWHDCRNSPTNNTTQLYCTVATPEGSAPTFMPNVPLSAGTSRSNGSGVEYGDYLGLAYVGGWIHPAWADISNSTGDNPNGTTRFEAFSNKATGGAAAHENTETLIPSLEEILLGTTNSGGNLMSWAADDSDARNICKFIVPNNSSPFIKVRLTYTTTVAQPSAVHFVVKVGTHTFGPQSITLLVEDKTNPGTFVVTSVDQAASNNGQTYDGAAPSPFPRYRDANGVMRGEIQIKQTGPSSSAFPCSSFEYAQMLVTD